MEREREREREKERERVDSPGPHFTTQPMCVSMIDECFMFVCVNVEQVCQ
jgi:hypothetical protein